MRYTVVDGGLRCSKDDPVRDLFAKCVLAMAALVCAAAPAMAQPVTFTGFANGAQAVRVDLTPNSPFESYTLQAGGFSTVYNGASFVSYCVDLFQWLPSFGTADNSYRQVSGSSFFGSRLDAVSRLFSGFSGAATTPLASAAFQLALWEVAYESAPGAYSLTTGNARFSDANSADGNAITLAQSYLNNLGSQSNSFQVSVLQSAGRQDVVFATPVPEPSTYALMFAGLMGVVFIARRRSKA